MTEPTDGETYLTRLEMLEYLGISASTANRLIKDGKITRYKFPTNNRSYRYDQRELAKLRTPEKVNDDDNPSTDRPGRPED